ncbi:unnamed protein product [Cylicostephanus goldi]|uniref:Dendritic cell-specific transmembrane protein-like domain-containing protein n=1 Tax=Cylicostephanus goldi TaxID=71465 RepID=A0A3P6QU35_CYLGO|nr:unnamed protein product [Cylicostephanus goldi]
MLLKGRTKALPLNKNEKQLYIPRSSWKMTTRERTFYHLRIVITLILSATPFCFICMDQAVYMVISNVFYFTGLINVEYPSHYEVKVSGKGQAAELMRTVQNTFSPLTTGIKERDERWRKCFVEPNPPDAFTLYCIIGMFFAALFLCRFQVWMSRQSLALADHFFPDRVRPRALNLYNKILQDRKNLLGDMMKEQKKKLADDQMEGRETVVRRGLQSRGFIRVNCSVCNQQDLRLADQAYVLCIRLHCILILKAAPRQIWAYGDLNWEVLSGPNYDDTHHLGGGFRTIMETMFFFSEDKTLGNLKLLLFSPGSPP